MLAVYTGTSNIQKFYSFLTGGNLLFRVLKKKQSIAWHITIFRNEPLTLNYNLLYFTKLHGVTSQKIFFILQLYNLYKYVELPTKV